MFGNIGMGLLAITASVVLGAASLGLTASGAHAEVNQLNEGKLSCELVTSKSVAIYGAGTRITVTLTDGRTETYRCDGTTGEWVRETAVVGGGLTSGKGLNRFRALTVPAGATVSQ